MSPFRIALVLGVFATAMLVVGIIWMAALTVLDVAVESALRNAPDLIDYFLPSRL